MKKKGLIIGIVAIIAITVVLFLAIGIKDKTNSNGEKGASTDTYTWVDSEGGSLTARFSTKTGKCTSFNGVF